jgi:hypothetical protein
MTNQAPNPNDQIVRFGIWDLFGHWSLGLGISRRQAQKY